MSIFSQRNHLWSNQKLGSTNLTIGADGCYTCVLAEINNIFGANCTPVDVANHKEWYNSNGEILNSVLATSKGLKNTIFEAAGAYDEEKIDKYLADWTEKQMAVKVQLPRGGTHFMKIDQKDPVTQKYLCDDPYSGRQVDIDHYGPIIGIRYFSKRIPTLI